MLENALIIQNALKIVKDRMPIVGHISTTFANGSYRLNDTVQAYMWSKPTVGDVGGDAEALTATTMPVKLDQFKQFYYKIPYTDINKTRVDVVKGASESLAEAIAEHFTSAALSVVTKANFSVNAPIVETTANTDRETLGKARTVLVKQRTGKARFGVVDPDTYNALSNDPVLGNASSNPQGGAAVLDGVISRAKGFTVYEYPEMPSGLAGFFGGKEAILFASGAPVDPSMGGKISGGGTFDVFTDADSGVSILAQEVIDNKDLGTLLRVIFLYGVGVGVKTAGVRLLTATES